MTDKEDTPGRDALARMEESQRMRAGLDLICALTAGATSGPEHMIHCVARHALLREE